MQRQSLQLWITNFHLGLIEEVGVAYASMSHTLLWRNGFISSLLKAKQLYYVWWINMPPNIG